MLTLLLILIELIIYFNTIDTSVSVVIKDQESECNVKHLSVSEGGGRVRMTIPSQVSPEPEEVRRRVKDGQ